MSLPRADPAAVAGAVVSVVAARPALAIACGEADGEPVATSAAPLHLRHIGALPHPRLLAELADQPFDLRCGPLLRAVVFDGALLLVASGFVADADSLGLLLRDIRTVLGGGQAPPATAEPGYSDAAAECWPQIGLRLHSSPDAAAYPGRRFVRCLPAGQFDAADVVADRLGTSRSDVFLAAYASLLHRLSGLDELVVGIETRREDAGDAIGPYTRVQPSRVDLCGAPTLPDLVARVRDARARHDGAAAGSASSGPAPDALVDRAAAPYAALFEDADDGLPGVAVFSGRTSARTDLALVVLPNGLGWEHGGNLSAEGANALAAELEGILRTGLAAPGRPLPRARIAVG